MKSMILSLITLFVLTPSLAFSADEVKKACLKDALDDWRQATQDANFELRSANSVCRFGPEVGACITDCLPSLKTCLQTVYASLRDCRIACFDTLIAARKAARDQLGCGSSCNTNADFQKAVVEANNAYQACRLACRSSTDAVNARAGCRAAHGLCVNACKSSGTSAKK